MPYSITFISEPQFVVQLGQKQSIDPKEKTLNEIIQEVAIGCFEAIACLHRSINKTNYLIYTYGWRSFKRIGLGWTGKPSTSRIPLEAHLLLYRLTLWSALLTMAYVNNLWKNFIEEINRSEKVEREIAVSIYAGEEINLEHFAINQLELDDSNVPEEVKVESLLAIYNEINFSNPQALGYMKDTSRQEGTKIYSVVELKKGLEDFVQKVTHCEPFLGTPPAHDFLQLNIFYAQIQKAVRLSINESNKRLEAFFENAGKDEKNYSEEQKRQYQDLLEDRARIAIDLAIAGHHCGARYMGEAMNVYGSFFSQHKEGSESLLKDHLYEILAQKRKEIAEEHIQTYMNADTHSYAVYMHQLGQILGIPGSKGVVEYLKKNFSKEQLTKRFFEAYTVDTIIDVVQNEVKKSGSFRSKINDWMISKIGDWKKGEYFEKKEQVKAQIEEVLKQDFESENEYFEYFKQVTALLSSLVSSGVTLPEEANWDDFLHAVLSMDQSKTLLETSLRVEIRKKFTEITIGKSLADKILKKLKDQNGEMNPAEFKEEFCLLKKAKQIVKKCQDEDLGPLETKVAERVILNQTSLDDVLEGLVDQAKSAEFLSYFEIEDMHEKGLSKELLEWFLVEHQVFHPLKVDEEVAL
jgi:hypothetical protein